VHLVPYFTQSGSSVHPPVWDYLGVEINVAVFLSQRAVLGFASVPSVKNADNIIKTSEEVSE